MNSMSSLVLDYMTRLCTFNFKRQFCCSPFCLLLGDQFELYRGFWWHVGSWEIPIFPRDTARREKGTSTNTLNEKLSDLLLCHRLSENSLTTHTVTLAVCGIVGERKTKTHTANTGNMVAYLTKNFTGRNHGYPQKGSCSWHFMRTVSLISGICGVM